MRRSEYKPSVLGRPGRPGPGRKGTIEGHPRRGEIEHDSAVGVPSRTIARKYDISKDVVALVEKDTAAVEGQALRWAVAGDG
jgi:hypothetical protein